MPTITIFFEDSQVHKLKGVVLSHKHSPVLISCKCASIKCSYDEYQSCTSERLDGLSRKVISYSFNSSIDFYSFVKNVSTTS